MLVAGEHQPAQELISPDLHPISMPVRNDGAQQRSTISSKAYERSSLGKVLSIWRIMPGNDAVKKVQEVLSCATDWSSLETPRTNKSTIDATSPG